MNKKISVIVFTSMLVVLLTSAAVPLPGTAAVTAEKSDLVNFKVVNKSSGYVYLWLDGPAFYYFAVKP
jgi:hypothetical protein